MKSYISRKLPLETRTTELNFDARPGVLTSFLSRMLPEASVRLSCLALRGVTEQSGRSINSVNEFAVRQGQEKRQDYAQVQRQKNAHRGRVPQSQQQ